ncbi:MAG: hypothetical protein RR531_06100 [Longicatena sp.]
MMNWSDYRKEIDAIKIKDTKKERWILNIENAQERKEHKFHTRRYAVVGACLLLIISGYLMFSPYKINQSIKKPNEVKQDFKELPKIAITQNNVVGFGFAGVMLPDASYFGKGNPILDYSNKTLPVYRNGYLTDGRDTILKGAMKEEQIDKIIEDYRKIFHFSEKAEKIMRFDNFVEAHYKEGNINVNHRGEAEISIKKEQLKDKNLDFTASNQEEAEKVALRFANYFKEELGLTNPKPNISCRFDNTREQKWNYSIYDEKKTIEDTIFSYSFRKVGFDYSETYINVIISFTPVEEKLGDYPIISIDKARSLFMEGQYISNSLPPAQGADIAFMEIVYLDDPTFEYLSPYYKVYAEMEDGLIIPIEGMKDYGIYYIPAISSEYLDIRLPDTSLTFN